MPASIRARVAALMSAARSEPSEERTWRAMEILELGNRFVCTMEASVLATVISSS